MLRSIILILAAAGGLYAQSWEALSGLRDGDAIRVREAGGAEHKGTFAKVSPEALTLRTGSGEVSIERARIRRVQAPSGARRARNAIIGAAVGIAVGATLDQTLGVRLRNEGNNSGHAAMYLAPTALLGGLGAAFPAYRTLYRAH